MESSSVETVPRDREISEFKMRYQREAYHNNDMTLMSHMDPM
jgi:hypothetical protein